MMKRLRRKAASGGNKSATDRKISTADCGLGDLKMVCPDGVSLESFVSVTYALSEMKDNPLSQDVQGAGLVLLRQKLEEDASCWKIVGERPEASKLILAAMKQYPSDVEIQDCACLMLCFFAAHGYSMKSKSVELALSAIENHPENQGIAVSVVLFLERQSPRNLSALGKTGFVDMLVSLMSNQWYLMPEPALRVLHCAAREKRNWEYLAATTVIGAILGVLQRLPNIGRVQSCGRSLLCLLMTYKYNSRNFYRKVFSIDPAIYVQGGPLQEHDNGIQFQMTHAGVVLPTLVSSTSIKNPDTDEILTIMRRHSRNVEVQMSGLVSLLFLSGDHDVDRDAIVAVMSDNPNSISIQGTALIVLSCAIRSAGANDHIMDATTGVKEVLKAPRNCGGDPWVQMSAMVALTAMTEPINRMHGPLAANCGTGMSRFALDMMAGYPADMGIQQQGCAMLAALLGHDEDAVNPTMDIFQVVDAVVTSMRNHHNVLACQIGALVVLRKVSSVEHNIDAIVTCEGIAAVLTALRQHAVLRGGCVTLLETVFLSRYHVSLGDDIKKRGICVLVRAVSTSSCLDNGTQFKTFLALQHVLAGGIPLNTLNFLDAGGMEAIFIALARHRKDISTQMVIGLLLRGMRNMLTSVAIEQALKQNIATVVALMNQNKLGDNVLFVCCTQLHWVLTLGSEYSQVIAEAGGAKALADALNNAHGHETLERRGLEALTYLSRVKANHVSIAASGGIEAIVAVMTRNRLEIVFQQLGFEALRNMSGTPRLDMSILKAGGLRAVLFAWKTYGHVDIIQQTALPLLCKMLRALFGYAWLWRMCRAVGG